MENVTIVVPTYNEDDIIQKHLKYHERNFTPAEIIVVDGGSTDQTRKAVRRAEVEVPFVRLNPANRSRQLSEGVRIASSTYLLFLHADTFLPKSFCLNEISQSNHHWGWFDCQLDNDAPRFRLLSWMISLRSALFSSPTGDQAIWVHRDLLRDIGGIPRQPLMEDVELSRRLHQAEPGQRIRDAVISSARRWKDNGYLKTIITMWSLKLAYYIGVRPERLARIYYGRSET